MNSPIKLVIFDIAGTIIEDHDEVLSSFRQALAENRISASDEELKEWKGAAKKEVIRHFALQQQRSPQDIDRTYDRFREILEERYRQGVRPIAGAEATFHWLRQRQITIATTTGFYREVRDLILRMAGWERAFQANICSSDVPQGRPAPFMIFRAMEATGVADVAQVVNVGDTPLDLQSAHNAGVLHSFAVLSGTHSAERLKKEKQRHILKSVAEIPVLLSEEYEF